MSNEKLAERQRFEEWYATHATHYFRDPIGSRDCALQWEAWYAALQAHAAEAAQPMTPRELAARVARGEKWEPAAEATQIGADPALSVGGCESVDRNKQMQAAEPVRQFRVVLKGSAWTDVKDPEIWASVTAHPESYETRTLYNDPQPAARVPDAETLRLHLGELTPDEVCVAKAAYRLALAAQENPNGV